MKDNPIIVELNVHYETITAIWSDGERTHFNTRNYPEVDTSRILEIMESRRFPRDRKN